MIKPLGVQSIAFSAVTNKNRSKSPVTENWEALNHILVLKSDDVEYSSLSVQDGELCYAITLKNGMRINSIGKKSIEYKGPSSRWRLQDSGKLVYSLKLKLAEACEHLENIWIKIPS